MGKHTHESKQSFSWHSTLIIKQNNTNVINKRIRINISTKNVINPGYVTEMAKECSIEPKKIRDGSN